LVGSVVGLPSSILLETGLGIGRISILKEGVAEFKALAGT
jgi:hypothetical protein